MNKSPLMLPVIALALVACANNPSANAVPPPPSVAPDTGGGLLAPVSPETTIGSSGEDCAMPPIEPPIEPPVELPVDEPLPETLPAGAEIPAPMPDPVDRSDMTAPPEDEWIDGCISPDEFTDDFVDEADKLEPGMVQLTVSNQSFAEPLVHLVIKIDDETVVDEEFDVGTQHNWKTFEVTSLAPGEHTITAESDTGASIERTFTVPDGEGRYLLLDYWESFNFDELDAPFQSA